MRPWRDERTIPSASRHYRQARQFPGGAGGVTMVNTEWGAFDNGLVVLPQTPSDNEVDREVDQPILPRV